MKGTHNAGKGDARRPTDKNKFDKAYDKIKFTPRCRVCCTALKDCTCKDKK